MKIHIVRQGETLWELAKAYNVPVGRLLEANPKLTESKKLQWGSKIRIPTGKVPVIQAQPKESRKRKPKTTHVKRREDQEKKEKEIAFTHSPKVSIDPDVFFLEEAQEAPNKKDRRRKSHDYPRMPYYPPPYLSSYYPYSWTNSRVSMHSLPHYPMMPPPYGYPIQYESSSHEV